ARLAQSSELAAAEKSRDLRGRAAVRGREDTHRAVGGEIDAEPVGAPALDERGRGGLDDDTARAVLDHAHVDELAELAQKRLAFFEQIGGVGATTLGERDLAL